MSLGAPHILKVSSHQDGTLSRTPNLWQHRVPGYYKTQQHQWSIFVLAAGLATGFLKSVTLWTEWPIIMPHCRTKVCPSILVSIRVNFRWIPCSSSYSCWACTIFIFYVEFWSLSWLDWKVGFFFCFLPPGIKQRHNVPQKFFSQLDTKTHTHLPVPQTCALKVCAVMSVWKMRGNEKRWADKRWKEKARMWRGHCNFSESHSTY